MDDKREHGLRAFPQGRRNHVFPVDADCAEWELKSPLGKCKPNAGRDMSSAIRLVVVWLLSAVMVTAGCSSDEKSLSIMDLIELTRCQPKAGHRQLSNYELVKAVDAIALVEVKRVGLVPPAQRAGTGLLDSQAEFEIETVLKGTIEPGFLHFFGVKDSTSRRREVDFSSPETGVNHFAPAYPCGVPVKYWAHRHYLLFLVRSQKSQAWIFPDIPLSRVNEEVDGEDSPWGQAVKHYIRIASLMNEQAEEQALRDLQARARRADDPMRYPPALVADVERHFGRKKASGS